MSKQDILKQYPEFKKLFTFLICVFGDYWEGRTMADFIAEVVRVSPPDYLAMIYGQLSQFLGAPIPVETKRQIVYATGVYYETPEEAVTWLNEIKDLLEPHVTT